MNWVNEVKREQNKMWWIGIKPETINKNSWPGTHHKSSEVRKRENKYTLAVDSYEVCPRDITRAIQMPKHPHNKQAKWLAHWKHVWQALGSVDVPRVFPIPQKLGVVGGLLQQNMKSKQMEFMYRIKYIGEHEAVENEQMVKDWRWPNSLDISGKKSHETGIDL